MTNLEVLREQGLLEQRLQSSGLSVTWSSFLSASSLIEASSRKLEALGYDRATTYSNLTMSSRSRQSNQWDLGRFVKTLSFYGAVPLLSQFDWFQSWLGSPANSKVNSQEMMAVMDRPTAVKPTIGVAGETGAVGNQVMQQLAAQGIQTRSLSRGQADLADHPVEVTAVICDGSALSEATVAQIIQQVDPAGWIQRPIFDFAKPTSDMQQIWGALDDVVMGGVSQSSIRFSDGLAYFSGQVSTANSGGFASVRTRNLEPALDLSRYEGVALCVKGDGQRYKFMLRTESNWDGVAYCFSFDTTAEQWITVRIPFNALIPVFRARTVPDRPVDPSRVCAWQLMLSKFEYDGALNPQFTAGSFQLQVASIQVYRQAEQAGFVLISPSPESVQQLTASGLSYSLIYPSRITASPGGQPLSVEHNPLTDQIMGEVNAADVAALSIAALNYPPGRFAVTTGDSSCAVGDWDCLLAG